MKQEQKIALALALIGGVTQMNKNENRSRNETITTNEKILSSFINSDWINITIKKIKDKELDKDKELATLDLIYFLLDKNFDKMEDLKINIDKDEIPIFGEDLYQKYKKETINYDEYLKYYFIDKNKVDQIKEIINSEKTIILTGNKEEDQENLDKIKFYLVQLGLDVEYFEKKILENEKIYKPKVLTPTDKISNILEKDNSLFKDGKPPKNFEIGSNIYIQNKINEFRFSYSYNEKDNLHNLRVLEKNKRIKKDYFDSVIKRSGIYLNKDNMHYNTKNAGKIEKRTPEDSLSNIISEDFHGRKEIYNFLKKSSDNYRVPNLYEYFIENSKQRWGFKDIETVLIALEKIGYFDQE